MSDTLDAAFKRIAFERARGHVQLTIDRVDAAPRRPKALPIGGPPRPRQEPIELEEENRDQLLVHGVVVRVFRGDSAWLRAPVTVLVWVVRDDDPHPQSKAFWLPLKDVRVGRVLEAWVEGEPAQFHVCEMQAGVIDVASETPSVPITDADFRAAKPSTRDRVVAVALGVIGVLGFAIAYALTR